MVTRSRLLLCADLLQESALDVREQCPLWCARWPSARYLPSQARAEAPESSSATKRMEAGVYVLPRDFTAGCRLGGSQHVA